MLLINEATLLVFRSKAYESHGEQTLDIVKELMEGNFTGEEAAIVVETTTLARDNWGVKKSPIFSPLLQ